MKYDKPLILEIKKVITENPRIKTFVFDCDFPGEPGQFVMTWIPGYDEKPFGIIKKDNEGFMISVAAVGESTKALHAMKEGERLGFRGPYGTAFTLESDLKTIAMVAGGYGMVPLSYVAQEARKKGIAVHLFLGARNKEELLFREWMEHLGVTLHLSTDDGSEGFKGYNTDLFEKEVSQIDPEQVYIVGPEIMEMKVAEICWKNNIPFEVSVERFMKCGFGICGQCTVDPTGWRMCVEGPVLNQDQLKKVDEFGKYHKTASGKLIQY